jgi:protein TonB
LRELPDPLVGDTYRRRLLEHIASYRRSPALTPGEPPTGTVMVRFSLDRTGDVLMVTVSNSSGAPDLDEEAVATIWRARPMPTIPALLPDRLSITLPVTFSSGTGRVQG